MIQTQDPTLRVIAESIGHNPVVAVQIVFAAALAAFGAAVVAALLCPCVYEDQEAE